MNLRHWLLGALAGGLLLVGAVAAGPLSTLAAPATGTPAPAISTPSSGGSQNGTGSQAAPGAKHSCDHANGG